MTVIGNYGKYDELFADWEQAKLESLIADNAIATAKRSFHDAGVALTPKALHALYATQNEAYIKAQELKILALRAKQDAKSIKAKTFVALLTQKIEAAGLAHLVTEAKDESLQAITKAGLRSAYSA